MLLRSNKAFFPRSLARDFFFVVPAVCGCIAVQASADVLVIERATYLFFLHRSCIIRQREGERESSKKERYIFFGEKDWHKVRNRLDRRDNCSFFFLPTISAIESRKIFVSLSL